MRSVQPLVALLGILAGYFMITAGACLTWGAYLLMPFGVTLIIAAFLVDIKE